MIYQQKWDRFPVANKTEVILYQGLSISIAAT